MISDKQRISGNSYYIKYFLILVLASFLVSIAIIIFHLQYPPENIVKQSVPIGAFIFGLTLGIFPILTLIIVVSDIVSLFILKKFRLTNLFLHLALITLFGALTGFWLLHYLLSGLFAFHTASFNPEFWIPFLSSFITGLFLVFLKRNKSNG